MCKKIKNSAHTRFSTFSTTAHHQRPTLASLAKQTKPYGSNRKPEIEEKEGELSGIKGKRY